MVTFKSIIKNPDNKLYVKGQCLSSDIKPTNNIANGSVLRELDTGKKCVFNEQSRIWIEYGTGEDRNGKAKKKNTIINSTVDRLFGDMNDGEVVSLLKAIKNGDVTVKVAVQTTLGVFDGDLIVDTTTYNFSIVGAVHEGELVKCICIPFWWPNTYAPGGAEAHIISGNKDDADWAIIQLESNDMPTTLTITEYELAGEPEPEPAVNWEYYRIEGDLNTLGSAEESKQLAGVLNRAVAENLPVIASIHIESAFMHGNLGLHHLGGSGAEFIGSYPLSALARSQIEKPISFFATIEVANVGEESYAEWRPDYSGAWIETNFDGDSDLTISAIYYTFSSLADQMGVSLSDVKTTIELFVKKEADEND